jgi:hypothetical protein
MFKSISLLGQNQCLKLNQNLQKLMIVLQLLKIVVLQQTLRKLDNRVVLMRQVRNNLNKVLEILNLKALKA